MAYEDHIRASANVSARCAVFTISDTRTESTDKSGTKIIQLLTEAGHSICHRRILPDEPGMLRAAIAPVLGSTAVDVILTNGGTGISRRDQTIKVIESLIEIPLPGFGELFRMLSWEQIGSGAMLSRAVGGVARGTLLFAIPGSTKACELATSRLILPELKHLLSELRK